MTSHVRHIRHNCGTCEDVSESCAQLCHTSQHKILDKKSSKFKKTQKMTSVKNTFCHARHERYTRESPKVDQFSVLILPSFWHQNELSTAFLSWVKLLTTDRNTEKQKNRKTEKQKNRKTDRRTKNFYCFFVMRDAWNVHNTHKKWG